MSPSSTPFAKIFMIWVRTSQCRHIKRKPKLLCISAGSSTVLATNTNSYPSELCQVLVLVLRLVFSNPVLDVVTCKHLKGKCST